jgi:hypothetical protein
VFTTRAECKIIVTTDVTATFATRLSTDKRGLPSILQRASAWHGHMRRPDRDESSTLYDSTSCTRMASSKGVLWTTVLKRPRALGPWCALPHLHPPRPTIRSPAATRAAPSTRCPAAQEERSVLTAWRSLKTLFLLHIRAAQHSSTSREAFTRLVATSHFPPVPAISRPSWRSVPSRAVQKVCRLRTARRRPCLHRTTMTWQIDSELWCTRNSNLDPLAMRRAGQTKEAA